MKKNSSNLYAFAIQDQLSQGLTGQTPTVYISKDGGSFAAASNSPSEFNASTAPGLYTITFTATECDCDVMIIQVYLPDGQDPAILAVEEMQSASGGGATPQQIWEYAGGRTVTNTIPTATAISTAVWSESARTLTASPTDISSLATSSDLSAVALNVTAIKSKTDNLPTSPAATGDIPSVASIQSGLAKTSDLTGLSTFDPSNDTVTLNSTEDTTLTAIKTKVDTLQNTDLTGIATSTNVSNAQSAIIAAFPSVPTASDIWNNSTRTLTNSPNMQNEFLTYGVAKTSDLPTDYAKPGDAMTLTNAYDAAKTASQLTTSDIPTPPTVAQIQDGLSTFNPLTDTVTINSTQAATMTTATGFATASDIPSALDNASAVWNSNSRTLTESALTAQNVWEYANRTLTTEQTITSDDISNIVSGVWSANARTLTESMPTEESITAKVWTYPNRTLTEDLSGLYCTRQDVEQRWGKLNVAVMADAENDGDEFTISTHIKAAIIKATNRINSELASSIYSLPFIPVPDIVKQHAAALAGVELYRVRSVAVTNDAALFTAAETEFSNWVIAVYNGLQIPGARELPE